MKNFAFCLIAAVAAAKATNETTEFLSFAAQNNKHYGTSAEMEDRMQLFKTVKTQLANLKSSSTVKINKFADLTASEQTKHIGAPIDFTNAFVSETAAPSSGHRMLSGDASAPYVASSDLRQLG